MTFLRLAMVAVASAAVTAAAPPLHVLRTSAPDAEPTDPITVTFDRPVADGGATDVDPATIFRIDPAVPGRVEWRDPVTLRFTPAAPLHRLTVYRVTIAAGVSGLDGSRLEAPYIFEVRPPGPTVVLAWSESGWDGLQYLPPQPTFSVLVAGPADAGEAERLIRVDFPRGGCVVPHTVGVRVVRQRPWATADTAWVPFWRRPPSLRGGPPAGGAAAPGAPTAADAPRVLELVPAAPLALSCRGSLILPTRLDETAPGNWQPFPLSVRGPLAVLRAGCIRRPCASGPARLELTTPVTGAELLRHVRLEPGVRFTVGDTAQASASWALDAPLHPRSHYAVVVDSALTDVFGSRLGGVAVHPFVTDPVPPTVTYEYGRLLVERRGLGTLAVLHVNVDTLDVRYAPVPDTMEAAFLADPWGGWADAWDRLSKIAVELRIPVKAPPDRGMITGVRVPLRARGATGGTLVAVRIAPRVARPAGTLPAASTPAGRWQAPIALVQVTDLAVHARVGTDEAAVWVTGVSDGRPRPGAVVELRGRDGTVRATGRTGPDGVARLGPFRAPPAPPDTATEACEECDVDGGNFEGYVVATLGDDRAVVGVTQYDPDLSPWRFGAYPAWGAERWPMAGAVFTERGIYRPGETVHARAIVRVGPLGALVAPQPGDSVRLLFRDLDGQPLLARVLVPGRFGTAGLDLTVPPEAPLGSYAVEAQLRRDGVWRAVAQTSYSVAEYRPPEFLVEAAAAPGPLLAGDTLRVHLSARYLFGAPMGRAPLTWALRQERAWVGDRDIPGLDGWTVGGGDWYGDGAAQVGPTVLAGGVDTLDAAGQRDIAVPVPENATGRAVRLTLAATVMDANRQTVSASASALVHASDFYLAVRPTSPGYVWNGGDARTVELLAVRPDGARVPGVEVSGALIRREWHQVRRYRGGGSALVGEMVDDTVARCAVRTAAEPARCTVTPRQGGWYALAFAARDAHGRDVHTLFTRWVTGPGFVPWDDASQLKLQLVPDRPRYTVGDTAVVLLASPFPDAEAWITVERERILEQRRVKLNAGSVALRFPITEALVPNAYVSVVVVRGRSAKPGPLDDPGRPTLRVGYAELRVTPELKRLAVQVKPLQAEYRPGDTARVALHVRDAAGRGVPAEVTLWAVDQGVLALTDYATPDPLDLIYRERGLGMRLASNLTSVAPQVPEGEKGGRAPGGGGGQDLNGVLRSRFRPTAFFLGSVLTDANGDAVAAGALPDNLTTFRVMAVAVTTGDRYGNGESSLLATRPLVARPALPRFLREGDEFRAGVVVNQRAGGTPKVAVVADATGVRLSGKREQTQKLAAGRGAEFRFAFRTTAPAGDSAAFRFDARGDGDADAVRIAIPVRPPYHPVVHTLAGMLYDTAHLELSLPGELDPRRSTLRLGLGTSPLAALRAYRRVLRVYPYDCTEQVTSAALPLIALYRAQKELGTPLLAGRPEAEIARAIDVLERRQGAAGGIGFWGREDWTTPWLSAYAGRALLDARDAGFEVSDVVLGRLAGYLGQSLRNPRPLQLVVAPWYQDQAWLELADRAAAADFLSRLGRPDVATENQLLGLVPRLAWEDRLLLAGMLARRGQQAGAAALVTGALAGVRVDGRRAVLPEGAVRRHYFFSRARPYARAVTTLLAVEPQSPLLGPLVATLVDQGRLAAQNPWNTQDYGNAAVALAAYWRREMRAGPRAVRLLSPDGRPLLHATARATAPADTAISLDGLLRPSADGGQSLRVTLAAPGPGAPVFWDVEVTEVPRGPAVTPRQDGIAVDRWYERAGDGRPVTSVRAGELVRVRLRITVPAERHFVVLDDALPAGLEPVDLSLRTVSAFAQSSALDLDQTRSAWWYGSWDSGVWSPFDHKELHDDRVVWSAAILWPGTCSATYLARATTVGKFAMPPAHAEEMYNPGVNGRSGGGTFTVTPAR